MENSASAKRLLLLPQQRTGGDHLDYPGSCGGRQFLMTTSLKLTEAVDVVQN